MNRQQRRLHALENDAAPNNQPLEWVGVVITIYFFIK